MLSICLVSLQTISAANITVYPGSSIQSAVNQASNGDTITVYSNNSNPYTYKESVTINKEVNIKASGNVTIQALNSSDSVFTVNNGGSGSCIQNFTLSNSNYGVMINDANNCTISDNNIIAASLVGIQFYGNMSNSQVIGNTITGINSTVGNGISFEYGNCTYNNITGNIISNFLNGILFNDNSGNNIVSNNTITCTGLNGAGIYSTDDSRSMQITGNKVTGARDGISIQQLGNNMANNYYLTGNTLSGNVNGFWICLSNSTISNNTANQNTVSGFDITGINNTITNNIADNNSNCGITLDNFTTADYNNLSQNTLNYNLAGINSASNYATISNNNINNNTDNGIILTANYSIIASNTIKNTNGSAMLLIGTYNTITNNILQNNVMGLCMQQSTNADNNTVSYNNITYNTNGINSASPFSTFSYNNINYNNQTGLTITGSGCNIFKNSMCYNGNAGITITSTNNNVTENRLENNLYGASFSNYNAATFNLNSVIGNTYQVYSPDTTGTINALNNWWGSNSSPTKIYGLFNINPWIVLQVISNPTQIVTGATSTITAYLTINSNGQNTTLLYPGSSIPDGILVNFTSDLLGSVNPAQSTTLNGLANTTYTACSAGLSAVSATVNGQNVTTNISINNATAIPTAISVNPIIGYNGYTTNIIATLTNSENNLPISGKTIKFYLNNTLIGTALTNSNGTATLPYNVLVNIGTYTILAQFIQDNTYAPSNNTNNLTVLPNSADVVLTNTASNYTPSLNSNVTFTVTVKNNGPCTAQNVTVSEWLSNNDLTYVSDDSGGSLNLSTGIWTVGNLASGATATLHIVATASTPNSTTTNTATYIPVTNDPNPNNNNQTITITVPAASADVVLTNTASNYTPSLNSNVTFTVTVKNNGPDTAQNVTVSEWLSNNDLTYVSDDSGGSLNLSTGIWTVGNLASGATATLHIVATASTPNSTTTNTATYIPVTNDPNPNNNNQTITITVPAASADVVLTNTASNYTPSLNSNVTFTVTVKNNGPDTAQNVTVSEWLSNNDLTYVSDDSGGSLNLSTGIWTVGNLASGATATLHIVATASTPNSTTTNTATYIPVTNDPNPNNNNQTITITVQ